MPEGLPCNSRLSRESTKWTIPLNRHAPRHSSWMLRLALQRHPEKDQRPPSMETKRLETPGPPPDERKTVGCFSAPSLSPRGGRHTWHLEAKDGISPAYSMTPYTPPPGRSGDAHKARSRALARAHLSDWTGITEPIAVARVSRSLFGYWAPRGRCGGQRFRHAQQATAEHITEQDAAPYIGLSRTWLRAARRTGRGPAFVRYGRAVRYRIEDLDAYKSPPDRTSRTPGTRRRGKTAAPLTSGGALSGKVGETPCAHPYGNTPTRSRPSSVGR